MYVYMHVDVHRVMFWMAATSEQGCLVCMASALYAEAEECTSSAQSVGMFE